MFSAEDKIRSKLKTTQTQQANLQTLYIQELFFNCCLKLAFVFTVVEFDYSDCDQ